MLLIRAGHPTPVIVAPFGLSRCRNATRRPHLRVNCEEVSSGSPLPKGPADHVINPSGSSNSCNCRHFRVLALPERHSQATF
eukprot:4594325-Pyramimonas_sp.AAC.1